MKKNWNQVLTPQKVREIKQRIFDGERQDKIAADYGVSQTSISRVKNNLEWAEVDCEVDVSGQANYWSFYSSWLADKVVSLYADGYHEYEIPGIINTLALEIDEEVRPKGQCGQPDVHRILQLHNVQCRHPRKRRSPEVVAKVKKLKANGWSYREIAEKFGMHYNTAWKYVKGVR